MTEVINKHMLSHGDTPMSEFGMPMSKREDSLAHTQIHVENIILMILRPKVKVIQRS